MKYLLDTNVLREIGRTTPHRHAQAWLDSVDDTDLAISALTVREVAKGVSRLHASKPHAAKAIADRMATMFEEFGDRVLTVDRTVAQLWGEMLAVNEKHIDDTGMAATARAHGLILVTRNIKHVVVHNVRLLNPFKSPPERLP